MKDRLWKGLALLCLAGLGLPSVSAAQDTAQADELVLPHPEVTRIEPAELLRLIEGEADLVIIDTRDAISYEYGHIEGAINIYYDPTGDPMTRELMLGAMPGDKLIVLYCP
jgi:predicted sulfurtransferase